MVEEWKPVVGYEGVYSVSNLGRIRLELRRHNKREGTIVAASLQSDGYVQVPLSFGGARVIDGELRIPLNETGGRRRLATRPKRFMVHRLVFEAFIGPIPNGLTINHKSGVKTDNSHENLEALSIGDNIRHAIRELGQRRDGEHNPAAKLNTDDVVSIRFEYAAGTSAAEIARAFGISTFVIAGIVRGRFWKTAGGPISLDPPRRQTSISDEQVRAVAARHRAGEPTAKLALEYNISKRTVLNFAQGKSRSHVL